MRRCGTSITARASCRPRLPWSPDRRADSVARACCRSQPAEAKNAIRQFDQVRCGKAADCNSVEQRCDAPSRSGWGRASRPVCVARSAMMLATLAFARTSWPACPDFATEGQIPDQIRGRLPAASSSGAFISLECSHMQRVRRWESAPRGDLTPLRSPLQSRPYRSQQPHPLFLESLEDRAGAANRESPFLPLLGSDNEVRWLPLCGARRF